MFIIGSNCVVFSLTLVSCGLMNGNYEEGESLFIGWVIPFGCLTHKEFCNLPAGLPEKYYMWS